MQLWDWLTIPLNSARELIGWTPMMDEEQWDEGEGGETILIYFYSCYLMNQWHPPTIRMGTDPMVLSSDVQAALTQDTFSTQ